MLYCPKQSRSPSGALMGVGPGLCRILDLDFREHAFF
jgi:hypothetical protein